MSNKIIIKTMMNKTNASPCYFFILFVVLRNTILLGRWWLHARQWINHNKGSNRQTGVFPASIAALKNGVIGRWWLR